MDFAEVERRYAVLKRQYDAEALTGEEFDRQLHGMMVQDGTGRWWVKLRGEGEWGYHDGATWVKGVPTYGERERAIQTYTQPIPAAPMYGSWAASDHSAQYYPTQGYSYGQPMPLPGSEHDNKAIASLVLGIISIVMLFVFSGCGIPFAIGGIALGLTGLKSAQRGIATAGIVTSIIGLAISLIFTLVIVAILALAIGVSL